ncbi:signal peptidase II [Thermodesulfovibrio sp. 3907-1M]|uniref:Lipoprotein signal peptidase n=1 Tax=Thermodesulfovibrio autotrophicus TaxID=3118333 RepID=A0AAU8GZF0_9BACT
MSLKFHKSLILIFLVVFFDQLTKYLAIEFLAPHGVIKLLPFFNLVYVENTGTAFGMFKFLGAGFFIVIALFATLFLIYMYFKDPQNWLIYSLIIAGALGNIIDRLIYGYVIDFIDLHLKNLHWPAFNVADSAISIGIVLFVYKSLKK